MSPTDDQSAAPPAHHALWIGGRAVAADSGATFACLDPYRGTVAAVYANAGPTEAQAAIAAARRAFDAGWGETSMSERSALLRRIVAALDDRRDAIACAIVREAGKTIGAARGEVAFVMKQFDFYASMAIAIEDRAIADRIPDALGLIIHEPIGVCALISAWNSPAMSPGIKIAAALAAGNTIVLKPSHLAPGAALIMAECFAAARVPEGVVNVVTSDIDRGATVGQLLAASDEVDLVSFTGSTVAGRAVMRAAAANNKRVVLELGGKSANIVFDDAPFDAAVVAATAAYCANAGQVCSAGTRLLVQRGVRERFVAAVIAASQRERLGDPLDEATTMGPLISSEQHQRVTRYIEHGRQLAHLALGGGAPAIGPSATPLFVEPTIFDRVDNASVIAQDEIFGPVLAVIAFDDAADAVRIANDSRYGLAGGVWTRSLDQGIQVARKVRTGRIIVNAWSTAGIDGMAGGGNRSSGLGRELGIEGLREYQQLKQVQVRLGVGG